MQVFCPPYQAPANGFVWYRGRKYTNSTLGAHMNDVGPRSRRVWDVGGKELPIARQGDIPAGQQVRASDVTSGDDDVDYSHGDTIKPQAVLNRNPRPKTLKRASDRSDEVKRSLVVQRLANFKPST